MSNTRTKIKKLWMLFQQYPKWDYHLGNAYTRLEKYVEVISDFSKAIELDPEDEGVKLTGNKL